jgi:hypothetical protein
METINKITFVLCEGKHDVALLTRLLRENNYKNYTDKKLKEFPAPIKGFLEAKINKFTYEDEFNILQKPQLPNAICKSMNKNHWYIFYQMGGDKQLEYSKSLISSLKTDTTDFSPDEEFETQHKYSLALFYDADNNVQIRRKTFINDFSEVLKDFTKLVKESESNVISSNIALDGFLKIGLYIYGSLKGSGTLEDIIIPIMKEKDECIFNNAEKYLKQHMSPESYNKNSKKGKALIGVVGQPKHNGKANQVIISDTKLITKSNINKNPIFRNILNFLIELAT